MDGPQNDKGLYALVPVAQKMTIRTQDMISWAAVPRRNWTRSSARASCRRSRPMAAMWRPPSSRPEPKAAQFYYVANFLDYRFLQVFYPTRGILAWYDRETKKLQPLPGADDPATCRPAPSGVPTASTWCSARAEAKDPYPPDGKHGDLRQRPRRNADSIRSLPHSIQRRQRRQGGAHRRRFAKRHEQQLPQDLARRQVDGLCAGQATGS